MKKNLLALMLSSVLVLASCNSSQSIPNDKTPSPSSSPSATNVSQDKEKGELSDKVISSANKFGIKLFNNILKKDKDKNIFLSPFSVNTALAMTYNGSDGTTKEAMEKTLELNGLSFEEINKSYRALLNSVAQNQGKVKIDIANSLWLRKGEKLKDQFLKDSENTFDAKVTELDFASKEAPKVINDWVSSKTNNKINEMIKQIDPATFLYLINAIYFKGDWSKSFDKALTVEGDFYITDTKTKKLPMMNKTENLKFVEGEKFRAVSIPYGKDEAFLNVFLPKDGSSLDDFYKEMSEENHKTWLSSMESKEVNLKFPKFKLEYESKLNESLIDIGMGIAFNNGGSANFSKLSEGGGFISEVKHKSFIEVNEEGTEAAAATSVAISKSASPINMKVNFKVDKPFFFTITDTTNSILFMGNIVEP